MEKTKSNPFAGIKNILNSLAEKVEEGKITLRDAAIELYRAGWYNYVPSEEQTRKTLHL